MDDALLFAQHAPDMARNVVVSALGTASVTAVGATNMWFRVLSPAAVRVGVELDTDSRGYIDEGEVVRALDVQSTHVCDFLLSPTTASWAS